LTLVGGTIPLSSQASCSSARTVLGAPQALDPASLERPAVLSLPSMSKENTLAARLVDRLASIFKIQGQQETILPYDALAAEEAVKVAVDVHFRKYLWDLKSFRTERSEAERGGELLSGNAVGAAVAAGLASLRLRFQEDELPALGKVLKANVSERLAWLGIDITELTVKAA